MELRAVIGGLRALRERCDVVVVTDSQYVKNGITEWLPRWKASGWKKKTKGKDASKAVLNQDLWRELDELTHQHTISWEWVKGHARHTENIRCDKLALTAARQQVSSSGKEPEAHNTQER
jgi:ribonuclease HI